MKYISLIISFYSLNLVAQEGAAVTHRAVDSIVSVIEDPTTHDTARAKSYLNLSEQLYLSNVDTMLSLCKMAVELAEQGIGQNPTQKVKHSFMETLSASYNNMGYVYGERGDRKNQIQCYRKGLKIAETIQDEVGITIFLNSIGLLYRQMGELDTALRYYNQALAFSIETDDTVGMASTYSLIARLYDVKGDIKTALEYSHKSLMISEKLKDQASIAFMLNNIGYLYQSQEDYKQAKDNYLKSLQIYRTLDNPRGISSSLNNLGRAHYLMKEGKKALEYYLECLAIREEIEFKRGIAVTLVNIGNVYYNIGEPDCVASKEVCLEKGLEKALEYYLRSVDLNTELNDEYGLTYSYNALANIYVKKNQLQLALKNGIKANQLATALGYTKNQSASANVLSEIYYKMGDHKRALDFYQQYVTYRDSLHNQETQKETAKQQAKYEYEKRKAVDDAAYEKQLAIELKAKEKQQIMTYITAGGLGLVGVFLLFVFNRLKVTRKQKRIIEDAHSELEEKNREILDSITYAKRIQGAILPPKKVVKEYLPQSFILYKPKDIVAGDFYWLENVGKKVLFAAADCTGHGVPGAMVSVVCHNGLNRSVREYGLSDPGKILNKTKEIVVQEFEKSEDDVKDGMDIALCAIEGNVLEYAGAHNPLWIIRKGASEIEEIKANKQPIGKTEQYQGYQTHKIQLNEGDTIYVFSDGYADQFGGEKGKKLKTANFKKLLLSIQAEPMEKQSDLIDEAFENWKGKLEQLDDVCVIGVRV